MKKTKLNIIKLKIIAAISTSICISCTPLGKVNPNKQSSRTTPRNPQKTKSLNNSENLAENSTKNPAENNQNLKKEYQNPKYSNQSPQGKITISKLDKIGKDLKVQEKQEDIQIANIDAQYDFLETFKLQRHDVFMHREKMKLKRIIYSSLNYEKEKILTLKEILEKLDKNFKNRRIAGKFLETAKNIQLQIEDTHLKKIQDALHTLSKEKAEELLQHIELDLKIRQNFAKTLNSTIDAYSKDSNNLKTNVENLATHIKDKYYEVLYLLN
ncbi:complement regulator-acquiring protein (plasmid) [Borreliella americana]|uniref:Complement regulator-acquiring protein n=1 Tax=Borreliella americana TaxID=478807 RepID=A0ACD5G608_9SPIR